MDAGSSDASAVRMAAGQRTRLLPKPHRYRRVTVATITTRVYPARAQQSDFDSGSRDSQHRDDAAQFRGLGAEQARESQQVHEAPPVREAPQEFRPQQTEFRAPPPPPPQHVSAPEPSRPEESHSEHVEPKQAAHFEPSPQPATPAPSAGATSKAAPPRSRSLSGRQRQHAIGTASSQLGACLTHVRLLRPARSGIFCDRFAYIVPTMRANDRKNLLAGGRLATAPMSQTGS